MLLYLCSERHGFLVDELEISTRGELNQFIQVRELEEAAGMDGQVVPETRAVAFDINAHLRDVRVLEHGLQTWGHEFGDRGAGEDGDVEERDAFFGGDLDEGDVLLGAGGPRGVLHPFDVEAEEGRV